MILTTTKSTCITPHRDSPHIALLLTTFNGEKFIEQQLDSIINQTHKNWKLYVSDDGSSDNTLRILQCYQEQLGLERINIFNGPQKGFAQNFLSLIRNPHVRGEYFSFSDQDDIWFKEKLERALAALSNTPQDLPALYCSRTRLINETGHVIGFSPLFNRMPSFRNALVQSLAGANTMLLNNGARELLKKTELGMQIVSHDWLTYLLVSGCDGQVIYDPEPTLDYRQHCANLIGSNSSFGDRALRIRMLISGAFREWNHQNIRALDCCRHRLSAKNQLALENFALARDASLLRRLYLLSKAGVYRQSRVDDIGLFLAASIRRI